MISYDSSCKFVFAALFFRRGSDNSDPHPTRGLTIPSARAASVRHDFGMVLLDHTLCARVRQVEYWTHAGLAKTKYPPRARQVSLAG